MDASCRASIEGDRRCRRAPLPPLRVRPGASVSPASFSFRFSPAVRLEANFSNHRALELTPKTWRWYKDKAPGGPLSQLAIHQFDVLHYLGGEVVEASGIASKLSPVGAEVDDQSMTLVKFADGKVGYVGSCWTSPGIFSVRVFGRRA